MKQKNISSRSNDLLTHFIGLGQAAFELKDVLKACRKLRQIPCANS